MKKVTFRLSDEARANLARMAKKMGLSMNQQLEMLLKSSTEVPPQWRQSDSTMAAQWRQSAVIPPGDPNDNSLVVKQPLLKTLDVTSTETSSTSCEPADSYKIPSPKTDPVACLVISFKTLKGVAHEDRTWDKIHFARNAAPAKKLLEVCGDFKTADRCLVAISTQLRDKGFPWSFETVVRQAHEWLTKERKTHVGNDYRQRLFDQLAKQRSTQGPTQVGANVPARSVLSRLRNLPGLSDKPRTSNGGGGSGDAGAVDRVREGPVETAPDRK